MLALVVPTSLSSSVGKDFSGPGADDEGLACAHGKVRPI